MLSKRSRGLWTVARPNGDFHEVKPSSRGLTAKAVATLLVDGAPLTSLRNGLQSPSTFADPATFRRPVASLRLASPCEVQAQSRYLVGPRRCRTPEPSDSHEVSALIASQVPGSDTRRVSKPDFAAPSGFLNLLAPYSSQNRPVLFHTVSASRVPFSESC